MLAANPALRQLLQGSEGTLVLSLRILHVSTTLLLSLCYLLCGMGDEKIGEREKVMKEIHQTANKPNVQSTSGRNRNEYRNAGERRTEHIDREANNIQGMQGEWKNPGTVENGTRKDMPI